MEKALDFILLNLPSFSRAMFFSRTTEQLNDKEDLRFFFLAAWKTFWIYRFCSSRKTNAYGIKQCLFSKIMKPSKISSKIKKNMLSID